MTIGRTGFTWARRTIVCTTLLLLGAGCPDAASHSPLPGANSHVTPPKNADTWGLIKPVKVMTPFVGSWAGETSTLDLRGELKTELKEQIASQPRITIGVLVEKKPLDFGDTAPYTVKISIGSGDQNAEAKTAESTAEIRIRDEQTLELRTASIPGAEFTLSRNLEDSEDEPTLQIESLKHQFRTTKLTPR